MSMTIQVLEQASIGAPITRVGVSFFPLYLHEPDGHPLELAPQTAVAITEKPAAEVPVLLVAKSHSYPALLLEGKIVGADSRTAR